MYAFLKNITGSFTEGYLLRKYMRLNYENPLIDIGMKRNKNTTIVYFKRLDSRLFAIHFTSFSLSFR